VRYEDFAAADEMAGQLTAAAGAATVVRLINFAMWVRVKHEPALMQLN
jgi:hypothetical protein